MNSIKTKAIVTGLALVYVGVAFFVELYFFEKRGWVCDFDPHEIRMSIEECPFPVLKISDPQKFEKYIQSNLKTGGIFIVVGFLLMACGWIVGRDNKSLDATR